MESVGRTLGRHSRHGTPGSCEFTPYRHVWTRSPTVGTGVIWSAVIPAKAGIYSARLWKRAVAGLDSRFRGNDRRLEWIPIPNDTSTLKLRMTSIPEKNQRLPSSPQDSP